jgi:hypothetical protein
MDNDAMKVGTNDAGIVTVTLDRPLSTPLSMGTWERHRRFPAVSAKRKFPSRMLKD